MSNCNECISQNAGLDLYQDLEYILKDITDSLNVNNSVILDEEKEEIINLCLVTLHQIYENFDEKLIRTFIDNLLKMKIKIEIPKQQKLQLKKKIIKKSENQPQQTVQQITIEQPIEEHLDEQQPKSNNVCDESIETISKVCQSPTKLLNNIVIHSSSELNINQGSNENNEDIICKNLQKIEEFKKLPLYKQKSKEWLDQRNNYLTASTIAAALGLAGTVARRNLLINKVSNGTVTSFSGNVATHWGNKYEPVANGIYSYRNKIEIHDFGMVTNIKYPILGVSPDGITQYRMIEIKCPHSRIIDGKIKTEYYHQMQEQMAVCEFDECDFLECKFEEVTEDRFWDDFYYYDESENKNREKGIIISYLNCIESLEELNIEYLYSPIEYHNDIDKLKLWEAEQLQSLLNDNTRMYLNRSYWLLTTYNCQLVKRDPQWIIDNYPILEAFWKEVEYYRDLGLEKLLEKIENDKVIAEKLEEEDDFSDDICKINKFYEKKNSSPTNTKHTTQKKSRSPTSKSQTKTKIKNKEVTKNPKGQCFL